MSPGLCCCQVQLHSRRAGRCAQLWRVLRLFYCALGTLYSYQTLSGIAYLGAKGLYQDSPIGVPATIGSLCLYLIAATFTARNRARVVRWVASARAARRRAAAGGGGGGALRRRRAAEGALERRLALPLPEHRSALPGRSRGVGRDQLEVGDADAAPPPPAPTAVARRRSPSERGRPSWARWRPFCRTRGRTRWRRPGRSTPPARRGRQRARRRRRSGWTRRAFNRMRSTRRSGVPLRLPRGLQGVSSSPARPTSPRLCGPPRRHCKPRTHSRAHLLPRSRPKVRDGAVHLCPDAWRGDRAEHVDILPIGGAGATLETVAGWFS